MAGFGQKHTLIEPFMQPVPLDVFSDYTELVKQPICMEDIERKLKRYQTIGHFSADMLLVFDNCRTYNRPVSNAL